MKNMLEGKTIALDVDGPLADLHKEWLRRYNKDWQDTLTYEQITQWDFDKVVKPECGEHIFDYLRDNDLYLNVPETEGARWAVDVLKGRGAEVIYVSSCNPITYGQKIAWLEKYGFLPKKRYPIHEEFIAAHGKHFIKADALVDDRPKNLQQFDGLRVLFAAPYNRSDDVEGATRLTRWDDIVRYLVQELEWRD